jgi:hypothetical protein
MMAMFTDAPRIGKDQIEGVLKANPDIVVGIDFPFWFAYGFVGGEELKAREAKLDEGLNLLEKLTMPVLLGDLPDMTGAQKRMLSPTQIPSPDVLARSTRSCAASLLRTRTCTSCRWRPSSPA